MKSVLSWVGPLANLLVTALSFISSQKAPNYKRILAYISGGLFLFFGFILGCMSLYSYLLPYWGEALSLLSLCYLFLIFGLISFLIGRHFKHRQDLSSTDVPLLEKVLYQLPNHKALSDMIPETPPKVLLGLCAVALLISYLVSSKEKKSK